MNPTLEDFIMALRYQYYVIGEPLVRDSEYDVIENLARRALNPSSRVHAIGSDLPRSYTSLQIDLAIKMRKK